MLSTSCSWTSEKPYLVAIRRSDANTVNSGTLCHAGNLTASQRPVHRTHINGERDLPWCVDHLQQHRKILSGVGDGNPRAPFWRWCAEERRLGKDVSKFGRRKRDRSRVNPGEGVFAQHFDVSIFEVERLVMNGHIAVVFDILA